ncbi:3-oxoacyl-ACP synthase III family protein [Ethanoligenens harbinense]|uniref:Beta-ketoacyl-[acyl-carrier-protein] synthase III n=1 Tax=Ethanoligenens harbinense (strain DSM 18485 / JCM 12961 / CGMCC 1.5033 / YUAN-3) TaxID=663278 RepID=E6U774_ETHHY|nr:beta-ketoacyl-ACP synthase III [Ethanoligenens harbinense]ADU28144.1 3-oxoacyl-(acyl-carrier-protein) synthase III [Ethanoligenens harbinense YUAN-3]AVQ97148.1 ketoacyl-ACP synthase III [Ethanoligenens harbinense YUAN-3]AYF39811.1 ketoacyl-ACP synthase III [Ethanoligenens harbinense]AYF42643.1 ketoacyl-ACP synthase III [Ethanoligenens harbinense]QCN93392.1 ketoacyl-ACP synthase III [Ethanoligenens harbinense]
MSGVFIAGTGMYVPSRVVTNDEMTQFVDTSDEWIVQRTGIRERHFSTGEPNWYMGVQAAKQAVKRAGIDPKEIDVIISCSITPDYFYPTIACTVQDELGADNAFCWNMEAACSGFVYSLDVARGYLSTGSAKNVLIVCSENMSKSLDFTDRSTCVLFGDGAGAAVVQRSEGLYASCMASDGRTGAALLARALPLDTPFSTEKDDPKYAKYMETKGNCMKMDGRAVYRFTAHAIPNMVTGACARAGIDVQDLDLIVPHQANLRIIETAADRLHVPMEKMYVNIDRYANTSCASVPICLAELETAGRLKRGDKVALAGFGGGLTCGAVVFEW